MRLKPKLRGFAWLLFLLYLVVMLKVILLKYPSFGQMPEGTTLTRLQSRLEHGANFTPFKTIDYYLRGHANTPIAVSNLGGNIILFSPLGLLVPFIFPRFRSVRQVTAIALGTSLFLELVQLLTGLGSFDVDDLLLNVVGGLIGVLAFKGVRRLIPSSFVA